MNENKSEIIGLSVQELERLCAELGHREFHGRQLFQWLYFKLADTFAGMTDLPVSLRTQLEQEYTIGFFTPSATRVSRREDAVKHAFTLKDGTSIEAVVLFDSNRRASFCVSSQVGCPVGCSFCATGKMGLVRDLAAVEIEEEILSLIKLHGRPDSILFMGMGEPLLNYENVTRAIGFLGEIDIGARKITVSTCGIVAGIRRLADSGLKVRLALSMGSAIEEKRKSLIPAAGSNPLTELRRALVEYRQKSGRRVSIEFTLIEGLNDGEDDADALARFAGATHAHVNIIRLNKIEGTRFRSPATAKVDRFKELLVSRRITVSERYRKGADIQGACGQLLWPAASGS
jgi:23S rRNA (adenine2503-C2)-methyltransferase